MLSVFYTEVIVTPHVDSTGTNIIVMVNAALETRIEPQSKEAKNVC